MFGSIDRFEVGVVRLDGGVGFDFFAEEIDEAKLLIFFFWFGSTREKAHVTYIISLL